MLIVAWHTIMLIYKALSGSHSCYFGLVVTFLLFESRGNPYTFDNIFPIEVHMLILFVGWSMYMLYMYKYISC